MRIGDEVRAALDGSRPVVALESTIITHGLPRPRNLDVARQAEDVVRRAGAVPATIGVVRGEAVVGLSDDDLATLAADDTVVKCGLRDLPVASVSGASGGTTVAATAWLAHAAGIKVFSTGGLGGVHRGASTTFDESADLVTLSRVPIVMVSAGVKSILDVPATLERLETLNIPVLGYRTDRFPGFYVRDSGCPAPARVETPDEVAAIARARDGLGMTQAVLVTLPVTQADELDHALHARVLAEALAAADERGVSGHDVTPFLLDWFHRETAGASLETNVALYVANIALGAQIATALAS